MDWTCVTYGLCVRVFVCRIVLAKSSENNAIHKNTVHFSSVIKMRNMVQTDRTTSRRESLNLSLPWLAGMNVMRAYVLLAKLSSSCAGT